MGAKEVIDAAVDVLKDAYTDYKCYTEKIQQGFKRPCFFVSAKESEVALLDERAEKLIDLSVVFYAKKEDGERERAGEVGAELSALFEWLQFGIGYKRAQDIEVGFDDEKNMKFKSRYRTHIFKKRDIDKMMQIKHSIGIGGV